MRKILIALFLLCFAGIASADTNAFFKAGPLELNIPLKVGKVVYMYDFNQNRNLVGAETPILTLWNRVEGTVGAVSSLEGQGTPFVGGNILIGNLLDKYVTLPQDLSVGGYGGWDFNSEDSIYGLKASIKLWN